MFEIIRF